ncbi:hypothetical protein M409DRAFT_60689 [Zasmidium cellare ATCC 36951]|uniref:amidase n=1 Tax=Zasmidium cellare ATCC 36951 TaxID=1080233 RepID=A0A6A6C0E2_ZASCE|nr:uncharacterized protein M409DRAFT_60689 [Zasmidium cellare ATCC 36951]KAF2159620.1 hypothetical protein M409DRAFT_60689 [Zasmidium cellare ATCC 36951]
MVEQLADMAYGQTWEAKAKGAREARDASLAKVEPALQLPDGLATSSQHLPVEHLTPREYDLTTNYSTLELLKKLRDKTLSAEELTRAFLRRAAIAQHATNCLTELMWDEAIERAKYLDSLPESLGPLHGLPISTKEHQGMHLYNRPLDCAYVSWIGTPSPHSPLNQILWDAGCVFYARTNQPQTLQCIETNNNIYGRTVNPWNRNLSSGGSSGGEGALIGMRGGVLGIGGDIGGSVRVPAGNNGLYGFKPAAKRLGVAGMTAAMAGSEGVLATYGPIATDRETIDLFMKVVLDGQPWKIDPSLETRFWSPMTISKPLKIGVMWSDGVVQPHPPVQRALQSVVECCKRAGMKVVDWEPLDHGPAWDLYISLLYPDGGAAARHPIDASGEPMLPLIKWITVDQPESKERTIHEYWSIVARRETYRAKYAAHWNSTSADDEQEVDVILCPAGPGAAPLHDTAKYWPYTSHWNLLDYPAVIFPSGVCVDPAKDVKDESYQPLNEQDAYNHGLYDPEKSAGAPVGLQVVGRKGMDEFVMAALREIEGAMGR